MTMEDDRLDASGEGEKAQDSAQCLIVSHGSSASDLEPDDSSGLASSDHKERSVLAPPVDAPGSPHSRTMTTSTSGQSQHQYMRGKKLAQRYDQPCGFVPGSTLTFRQFFAIWTTYFAQGLQMALPYTVAVYMVREFYRSEHNEEKVGSLTGLLTSFFSLSQFLTSYAWGTVSDSWGRKPVILLGNVTSCLAVVAFGLSGSFWAASVARFSGGLFNGIAGALKTMLGETCGAHAQARTMGYLNLAWGLGTILGPAIGGFLSYPCQSPESGSGLCAPGGLFQARPFLLPCGVVALSTALATALSAALMQETLGCRAPGTGGGPEDEEDGEGEDREGGVTPRPASDLKSAYGAEEADQLGPDVEAPAADPEDPPTVHLPEDNLEEALLAPSSSKSESESALADVQRRVEASLCSFGASLPSWARLPQVWLAVGGYGLVCLTNCLLDEVTPIFASAPRARGGLGWGPDQLAWPLSFRGLVLIIYSVFIYARFQERTGVLFNIHLGIALAYVHALLVPVASLAPPATAWPQVIMWLAHALKAISATSCFTGSMIMTNTVSPPGAMGAVNGAGQTLAAGMRTVGPALGGYVWALSMRLWGRQFVVFELVCVIVALMQLVYWQLGRSMRAT